MDFDNDADWDMMELERAGALATEAAKRGECDHGWQGGAPNGMRECYHCHKIAPPDELERDRRRILYDED